MDGSQSVAASGPRTGSLPVARRGQDAPGVAVSYESVSLARPIGLDDIFFSMTDVRGIILTGNSVFSRIAGYTHEEMVGAPHNLIRHPEMPAGVFSVMWDRLLSGQPMAGYVLNRAHDGSGYWVFATITPLGEGFLSVRTAPQAPFFQAAANLYSKVRQQEHQARVDGHTAAVTARGGARLIADGLARLGFATYDDFMAEALPAEVAARAPHAADLVATLLASVGDGAHPGPVRDVLVSAAQLDGYLAWLVARLDIYREVTMQLTGAATELSSAAQGVTSAVNAAREAARSMEASPFEVMPAGTAPKTSPSKVLRNVAEAMVEPAVKVSDMLNALAGAARASSKVITDLRVRISLARLHTEMVTVFAGEVLAGDSASAHEDIPPLCDALHNGLEGLATGILTVNAQLATAASAAEELTNQFNEFRRLVGMWRILVMRHRVGGLIGAAVGPIDELLDESHGYLDGLAQLSADCRRAILPVDSSGFDLARCDQLQITMRQAAARL